MNRKEILKAESSKNLFDHLQIAQQELSGEFLSKLNRSLPFNDLVFDRWEKAKSLGFGEGSSIYDNCLVFLPITVGKNVWIGPNTVLDGSGTLTIGDNCTISVGVQIYTHDNVLQTLSGGELPIDRAPVAIGNNVYIGPNAIIAKNISIGNNCVIGAQTFVNKSIPDNSVVVGTPCKIIGSVIFENGKPILKYN
jgi:acetyltransferase-like isoleucine patch superfamily enzyme